MSATFKTRAPRWLDALVFATPPLANLALFASIEFNVHVSYDAVIWTSVALCGTVAFTALTMMFCFTKPWLYALGVVWGLLGLGFPALTWIIAHAGVAH